MTAEDTIVTYAIYPAIGVARVGNALDEYYIEPQVPGQVPPPPYKDAHGAVKRQAAQFRVYGLNAAGAALKEITADDAQIEWRVHLANRKAIWYQFLNAMDLGEYALAAQPRNNSITGADRGQLLIDPGARTIGGRSQSGPKFDTGEFMTVPVYLGELRTDEQGRLLVLGGYGHSASGGEGCSPAVTFANNDGWHDDTADGPVWATVRVGGQSFQAEPAVVVCTPPNFGQGLFSVVTMYDVVLDLFVREFGFRLPPPAPPDGVSFWRGIYPIFERLVQGQWVNDGIYFLFGQNSPSDLLAPELLNRLANPSEEYRAERERLFRWFRAPGGHREQPVKIPPFYGDGFGDFYQAAIDELPVTATQYQQLQLWVEGRFAREEPPPPPPRRLAELPVAQQPHALNRAALEECLGGPFHPGIELTWPMRQKSMWKEPFRLNVLPQDESVRDDYGPILRPDVCLGPDGPLTASGPGTLTRWMGVPWQTDEASCLSGYDTHTYLPLPSFWAVRVPNQVLSNGSYERALDTSLPRAQRLKHFDYRQFWLRDLGVSYQQRINDMVQYWDTVGIVAEQPGPADAEQADLPRRFWVETGRAPTYSVKDPTWQQVLIAEDAIDVPGPEQPRAAAANLAAEQLPEPIFQRRRRYTRGER